jgi:hypothetical protein
MVLAVATTLLAIALVVVLAPAQAGASFFCRCGGVEKHRCGGVEEHPCAVVCTTSSRGRMEYQCFHMASTERRHHVLGDTSPPALARQRGSSPPVRTLSSSRAAADRARALVLTPESESPCARTPGAASARSHHQQITRSCFSRPSLHQTA